MALNIVFAIVCAVLFGVSVSWLIGGGGEVDLVAALAALSGLLGFLHLIRDRSPASHPSMKRSLVFVASVAAGALLFMTIGVEWFILVQVAILGRLIWVILTPSARPNG